MRNRKEKLEELAQKISQCRRCDKRNIAVRHCPPMNRGGGRTIFVIGEEPGNVEVETGKAFSGLAGKRLVKWLIEAGVGNDEQEVWARSYFTSLLKCNVSSKNKDKAIGNCIHFLSEQIELINPNIVITLGALPLRVLLGCTIRLEDIVGNVYREEDFHVTFFPVFPDGCQIIPLPHPSPRSMWLNDSENKKLLSSAIAKLREILCA